MLTRLLTATTLAAVLTVPLAVPIGADAASTAGSSAAGCVKKSEFKAVEQGWTPRRVANTFGTDGKRVTSAEFSEVRRYPKCSGGTSVIVNFERKAAGKPLALTSKYW